MLPRDLAAALAFHFFQLGPCYLFVPLDTPQIAVNDERGRGNADFKSQILRIEI